MTKSFALKSVFLICLTAICLCGVNALSMGRNQTNAGYTPHCAYICIGSTGWIETTEPCTGCLRVAKTQCGGGPVDVDCR